MDEPKRYLVKYIRDGAKARYDKGTECRICGIKSDLQLHHYYTLSVLVNRWVKEKGAIINTAEEAFEWRDVFIDEHPDELYKHVVTLCKKHHAALHKVYGKNPLLFTATKQEKWVEIQRSKHGLV